MTRVGIIGAGSWASRCHIPVLLDEPDVDVVIVASRTDERAAAVAAHFGIAAHTSNWRDVFDLGVDAVVIASPPVAHEEQVTAALQAGAHVLCEKPFALSTASAQRMKQASEAAGRGLLIAFGWNYMPLIQAAREWLESPGIGTMEFMSLLIVDKTRSLLQVGTPYPSASPEFPPRPATYGDPSVSGGGVAAVTMSHAFALIEYLCQTPVVEIYARMAGITEGIDLHDAMTFSFRGGGIASVAGASAPDSSLEEVGWHVRVIGDQGDLLLDTSARSLRMSLKSGDVMSMTGEYVPHGPARRLAAVCRGEQVGQESPARMGLLTTMLTQAAYESARSNRPVQVAATSS